MAWSTPNASRATGYLVTAANWNELAANFVAMVTDGQGVGATLYATNGISVDGGFLRVPIGATLTIATGAVTASRSRHAVDTEASASSDDLDTINGGTGGDIIILSAANNARTVVIKDATGNIQAAGDFSLTHAHDTWMGWYDGSAWRELSRSDNTA